MSKIIAIAKILIGLFNSTFKIGLNLVFSKKPKVIFYYPQHFNRFDGCNPYFESLVKICIDHKISYLVFEEPEIKSIYPRNRVAIPSDVIHYNVLLFRKLLTMANVSFWQREKILAKTINLFTFFKYKVDYYITISGNMMEIFQCMNPNAKVFDVQHGILYSTHHGYFNSDGKLREVLSKPSLHFLVSGVGFKNCFNRNRNNDEIMKRVHVIGAYDVNKQVFRKTENIMFFSLQFVSDYSHNELQMMKHALCDIIDQIDFDVYQVVLKHHPRFNHEVDLSALMKKHPTIKFVNNFGLREKVKLHITLTSTTSFEFAEYGIPTFFVYSEKLMQGKTIFYDEYNYPLYFDMQFKDVLRRIANIQDYEYDGNKVKNWFTQFYSLLDEDKFLNLLK